MLICVSSNARSMAAVVSTSNRNSIMYLQYVIDGADNYMMCIVMPSVNMMMASSFTGKAGTRNFTIKTMAKIVEQSKGIVKSK